MLNVKQSGVGLGIWMLFGVTMVAFLFTLLFFSPLSYKEAYFLTYTYKLYNSTLNIASSNKQNIESKHLRVQKG